jgi:hypothetical protein
MTKKIGVCRGKADDDMGKKVRSRTLISDFSLIHSSEWYLPWEDFHLGSEGSVTLERSLALLKKKITKSKIQISPMKEGGSN